MKISKQFFLIFISSLQLLFAGNSIPEKLQMDARYLQEERIRPEKLKLSLPAQYDLREQGKATPVKNQGEYGTCWAFAALTAMETAMRPEITEIYSPDHMTFHNSFYREQDEGGAYIVAMSYLAAWQGPVLEEMDPYGDGKSPDGLAPVRHVQEIQVLQKKDYQSIKETVYRYGGVDTSIYMDFDLGENYSPSYNKKTASYCYSGSNMPNHEVVIIGWDDQYPAENFKKPPEGDGAFLCQNSWGTDFGENGLFYVSYYDTNVGAYSIAYTGVEEADNYDSIYQTDLCGWSGQVGYNTGTGYFANVYTAKEQEELAAVGFYTVSKNTEYEVYMVPEFTDMESLNQREFIKQGCIEQSGYYTVKLNSPIALKKGQRFAVVVKVKTDTSVYPIAVESEMENGMTPVDLTDGEGYISAQGVRWEKTEEKHKCNVCLKVYTRAGSAQKEGSEENR